jgi:hypothetical protein
MRRPLTKPPGAGGALIWDLLTFDRLMTNEVIHLIYWAGLGLIAIGVFGSVGAAVGMAIRDPFPQGVLMAVPLAVVALLLMGAMLLIWRAVCEFYVAVFRISEDLRAMREADESPAAEEAVAETEPPPLLRRARAPKSPPV